MLEGRIPFERPYIALLMGSDRAMCDNTDIEKPSKPAGAGKLYL
jgi:hypothetical protein